MSRDLTQKNACCVIFTKLLHQQKLLFWRKNTSLHIPSVFYLMLAICLPIFSAVSFQRILNFQWKLISLSIQNSPVFRNLVKLFHPSYRSEVLELFLSLLQQNYSEILPLCFDAHRRDARMPAYWVPPARVGQPYILVSKLSSRYPSSVSFELVIWIHSPTSQLQNQSFCHSQNHIYVKKSELLQIILGTEQLIIYPCGQGTMNVGSKLQATASNPVGQEMHERTHLIYYMLKL